MDNTSKEEVYNVGRETGKGGVLDTSKQNLTGIDDRQYGFNQTCVKGPWSLWVSDK